MAIKKPKTVIDEMLAASPAQSVQPSDGWSSGIGLAVIGCRHFGNPIPKAWYDAAKELLSHAQAKPEQAAQQMSIEEIDAALQEHKRIDLGNIDPARGVFILGVVAAERHHGIAAPQPKD